MHTGAMPTRIGDRVPMHIILTAIGVGGDRSEVQRGRDGVRLRFTTLLPLRPIKCVLIAMQYHFHAAEGRLAGHDAP